ncbi:MAG: hypothetical protein HN846_02990 [Candidatus Pacebacteria bacterium]|jgi:hypothetical protein|nr:hypothetical protein [Candidatus Paceibacterota bacterium]MBT3511972.1 hypothetical protein [Candidatus Paceibacterota bacterium]MBT4005294.1 hypothetical protein [Candidatus Paceibacterota bacterium]MBT4358513.1 hypothetical protein [Candidatus Paceibacterota bacterium]MBT4681161.1 hypothetical protein [Candidatus Paceibacterota bacterium]
MKKEMLISVLVGLFFGLIIVYGVYTAQSSLAKPELTTEKLEVSPSVEAENETTGILSIHSPEDETIVNEPVTTITGTTIADSYVVIFINDKESITNADESGNFSIEGELELGSNIIEVHVIDSDGKVVVKERTIIYTTKPLVEESSEVATDSAKVDQGE